MKLMLLVMSIVILGLSSCFPVPIGCHAPRIGYVRPYPVMRVYAPHPHYYSGHYGGGHGGGGHYGGGHPRGR